MWSSATSTPTVCSSNKSLRVRAEAGQTVERLLGPRLPAASYLRHLYYFLCSKSILSFSAESSDTLRFPIACLNLCQKICDPPCPWWSASHRFCLLDRRAHAYENTANWHRFLKVVRRRATTP